MNRGIIPAGGVNLAAVAENERNRKHITLTHGGGVTTLSIGKKATYKGVSVERLSAGQKKKLENVVLFMYIESLHQMPIIKYI